MIIVGIVGAVLFALSGLVASSLGFWFGVTAFLLSFGGFILQGIKEIPADPPHKAILTVWKKRQPIIKDEGWRFFPFLGFWHDFILVNVTKVNQKLEDQKVRTPDLAELKVPVSLTWTPVDFIAFLNSGGQKKVEEILKDIVQERLREWAFSSGEGPQSWQELLAARDDATAILLKSILGDELKKIPSSLPTSVLLKYYSKPRKIPTKSEKESWGENWSRIDEVILDLDDNERSNLESAVEIRRQLISQVHRGNGNFLLKQLGISINRLNIGEIELSGELARVAELEVKEEREKAAETAEILHLVERISYLIKEKDAGGLGMTIEEAKEFLQTERGKVVKTISETKLTVSPETREMLTKIFPELLAIFPRRS